MAVTFALAWSRRTAWTGPRTLPRRTWMTAPIDTQDHDAAAVQAADSVPAPAAARPNPAQAERELRVREAKFAGIIAIASDAIISVDEDQPITLFNHPPADAVGTAAAAPSRATRRVSAARRQNSIARCRLSLLVTRRGW
jgi:PAS domain-containing protein